MEESSEEDLTAVGRFHSTAAAVANGGAEDEEEDSGLPPGPPPQFADSPQAEEEATIIPIKVRLNKNRKKENTNTVRTVQ
jgi:hypothetical protein